VEGVEGVVVPEQAAASRMNPTPAATFIRKTFEKC
jgi:hypothetical protein